MNWLMGTACVCAIAVSAHYGYEQFEESNRPAVAERAADDVWTDYAKAAALKEDCETLVGPQKTAILKAQYKQCLQYRRSLHGL